MTYKKLHAGIYVGGELGIWEGWIGMKKSLIVEAWRTISPRLRKNVGLGRNKHNRPESHVWHFVATHNKMFDLTSTGDCIADFGLKNTIHFECSC